MTFIIVLSALLLNHYWRHNRLLAVDGWFERWLRFLESRSEAWSQTQPAWPLALPMLAVVLPLLPVALLLWLVQGQLMGLLTLALHLALVMYCLPRVNLDTLVEDYLERWNRGNFEAAYLHSEQLAPGIFDESFDDYARMHEQFSRFVLVCCFRRIMAVLFWYILLGPLAALFYVLIQFLLRSHHLLMQPRALRQVQQLLAILDWLPVRLVALAFALAGDFVAAFNRLRSSVLEAPRPTSGLRLLQACAHEAMGPVVDGDSEFALRAAADLQALRSLLQRTQLVWVAVLALIILVV